MKQAGYHNILTKSQRDLLPKLKCLKDEGLYLAGGTGLALQIGHRTSADFDFYSPKSFNSEKVVTQIEKSLKTVKPIQVQEDTLILKHKGIIISLFAYPYLLLKPLLDLDYVSVASLEDIAAMKLAAIIQRGTKRDFIDIYYLIKRLGLAQILELAKQKYKEFNPYLALQALIYFEDADRENLLARKIRIKEQLDWDEVKNYIVAEVKKVRRKL